ncbi:unnamed protein product, partial [Rotaria sp. Silwood2]
ENVIFNFYRNEDGSVKIHYLKGNISLETIHYFEADIFKIRLQFNENGQYKTFAIQYKNFINEQQNDVRYDTLNELNQKIRSKLNNALREL